MQICKQRAEQVHFKIRQSSKAALVKHFLGAINVWMKNKWQGKTTNFTTPSCKGDEYLNVFEDMVVLLL